MILKRHDIVHWLEAGTCLGAVREKAFIGHDSDIDLGVWADDVREVDDIISLMGSFMTAGFRIYHTFGDLNCGFEMALWRDGIKIDIFWFYKKGDKRWMAAWLNGGRRGPSDMIKLVFDSSFFERMEEIEFYGHKFCVPTPVEKYLVARYGDDWKTPRKDWDWSKDPKCIDPNFQI